MRETIFSRGKDGLSRSPEKSQGQDHVSFRSALASFRARRFLAPRPRSAGGTLKIFHCKYAASVGGGENFRRYNGRVWNPPLQSNTTFVGADVLRKAACRRSSARPRPPPSKLEKNVHLSVQLTPRHSAECNLLPFPRNNQMLFSWNSRFSSENPRFLSAHFAGKTAYN